MRITLARRIRAAAQEDGETLSAWLSRAAERKLLLRNAARAIEAFEAEDEPITDQELERVRERLST